MKNNALPIHQGSNPASEEAKTIHRLELMVEKQARELQAARDQLHRHNKMASLGKLTASVSHEINNAIAGILNLTLLIKRIVTEESDHRKESMQFGRYLDLMETEIRRISRIASNLLTFSRQTALELKPLNLNRLIERTLLLKDNLFKIKGIRVEKKLSSNLPEIMGSADQLQQVLMNIISNAVEAMEATGGGLLTIETRYFIKGGIVQFRINDSGIGIAREDLPRLFDPFFTTKNKDKGIGLGLSVVYEIITAHGGTIDVVSDVGAGTGIVVELPLKRQSAATGQFGD
ncbi:MAG: GHKL domain-containing protein [Proteobacteria bacterium]|nr:GHKL domain-containing protein [Pseudomonadota bacterium]